MQMQDIDELTAHRRGKDGEEEEDNATKLWEPSGSWWRDFLYFSGPGTQLHCKTLVLELSLLFWPYNYFLSGWFVSIAYVDPGNYQADIQAGATSRYSLLFALWWTGILSIYVQILCVRLAFRAKLTLSQVQAQAYPSKRSRYFNWAIAEFSTIITDCEYFSITYLMVLFFHTD